MQEDMTDEMKIEIGRMLMEGVSLEGIQVVMDAWLKARSVNPDSSYASFTEIGLLPLDPNKTVEGSLVVAPTGLPEPKEYGPVNVVVEGPKITQSCPDCGTVFLQYFVPPGGHFLPSLAHPYIMCCGKLRRIGP